MIHEFIYEDKSYEVDDSKRFSEQSEAFKSLWNSLDRTQLVSFSIANIGDLNIAVYDMGGISVSQILKEEEDGEQLEENL